MKQNIAIFFAYLLGIVAILISLWRCEPFEIDTVAVLANILALMVTILLGIIAYNYFIQKEDAEKFKKDAKELIEKERAERNKQFIQLQDRINSLGTSYVDNPEWIYLISDAKDKELFGIHTDGSVDWQIGVPGPIEKELEKLKKEIEELKKQK